MCRKCNCSETENFDARAAFENLARKHEQLSEIVAKYMSEAPLDRSARARNAIEMAETITSAIIGGGTVPPGIHPECCVVGQINPNGTFSWYCSGVLIHPRAVLTAAHCHNPQQNQFPNVVALNTSSLNAGDMTNAEVINLLRPPQIHRFFNGLHFDLAVLILKTASTVPPVPRASVAETRAANAVTVAGFGNTDPAGTVNFGTKREIKNVPIRLIRRNPGEDFSQTENIFGFESDIEFVAGGNGLDACFGDSGGPAYINVGGVKKVAGLVARKVRNAVFECGDGSVYTRLDMQESAINEILNKNL